MSDIDTFAEDLGIQPDLLTRLNQLNTVQREVGMATDALDTNAITAGGERETTPHTQSVSAPQRGSTQRTL